MSDSTGGPPGAAWFRALLDTAPDVYFRYALVPTPRFVYLSPSVKALTARTNEDFYADPSLCLTLVSRADRRLLRQVLRSRRGLTLKISLLIGSDAVPIELRTVAIMHRRQIVAVEGAARLASSVATRSASDGREIMPFQQRLAALMYEVHDLLHQVLPPLGASTTEGTGKTIRVGELTFDSERLVVSESGRDVSLTSREVLVLRHFLRRPGLVVTRRQLLEEVWGYRYTGDDRTVDVHVSRLRRKLPSLRGRLVAIKHVGYRLDVEADAKVANF